jgi:hypothetical protein
VTGLLSVHSNELQHLKEKWPGDRIKRFRNVNLQQNGRKFLAVQPPTCQLDRVEIIMNGAVLNEGPLIRRQCLIQSFTLLVNVSNYCKRQFNLIRLFGSVF